MFMCISANCWSPWLDFFLGKILRIGGVLHISQMKSFSCCQNILDATTAGCTHIAMYRTWNFSACKSPRTQPKMTLLANLVSALYINPLSCPAVHMCTTQMNSFLCAILLALGRRANFVCACISLLNNEGAKFSRLPPVHPWFMRVGGVYRVRGWLCRKLFASCGSDHQTSIQALQPPLASISTSHQSWWAPLF